MWILDAADHSRLGRLLFRYTQALGWSPEPYIGFPSEPSLAKERLGFSPTIAAAFFFSFLQFCPFVQEEHFDAWAVQNQLERDWGGVAPSPFSLRGQANTRRHPRTTWRQLLHHHWRVWNPVPWTFIFFLDSDRGPVLTSPPLGLSVFFIPGGSLYDFLPFSCLQSLHSDSGSGGKRLLFSFFAERRDGLFQSRRTAFIPLWEEGQTKESVARVQDVGVLRGSGCWVRRGGLSVGACRRTRCLEDACEGKVACQH